MTQAERMVWTAAFAINADIREAYRCVRLLRAEACRAVRPYTPAELMLVEFTEGDET